MVLWISLAGGVGALSRFIADGLIRTVLGRQFPCGTLLINISGSFILGIVTGLALDQHLGAHTKLIIGTGFCGGFTTFSTASFEAVRLVEERRILAAVLQVFGNAILSILAAGLGIILAIN